MIHMAGFSKKGLTHERNEDSFLVHQNDDIDCHLGIVSDGCSSVRHGDFASRLMTFALFEGVWSDGGTPQETFRNMFQSHPTFHSPHIRKHDWGSATAGIVQQKYDSIKISLYGDGVIVYKRFDESPVIIHIEYENNTPWYPVYEFIEGLPTAWKQTKTEVQVEHADLDFQTYTHHNKSDDAGFWLSFYTKELESVTVLTDGICSGKIEWMSNEGREMIKSLLEPRRGIGDWGTRMLNRFYRKYGPFEDDLTGVAWRNEVGA